MEHPVHCIDNQYGGWITSDGAQKQVATECCNTVHRPHDEWRSFIVSVKEEK